MVERVDEVNRPLNRIRYGWPLGSADWENLPPEVRGDAAWHSRTFGYATKDNIPTSPGVYMMCGRPPNGPDLADPFGRLMCILYVGKANNLNRRFREHLNTPSPKVRAARNTYSTSLQFWFSMVPENRIDLVEGLLIECFGPPANDRPGTVALLEAREPVRA